MKPAPYPADTRAKGWRFELDLERIEQSDTWALAAPDVRPWLFLLWAKSWQQVPCGSLPSDDALIAARIGMAPKAFTKAKAVLLRGWWLADDGRLYHDVIAARVQSMLDAKRKESDRKAAYRAKMDAERGIPAATVPPVSHGTTTGQPPPSTGCDATGTGTGTGTRRREEEKAALASLTVADLVADGLSEEVATAWIAHRKAKKAKLTPLAWAGFKAEVTKAGWQIDDAVRKAIARNWTAFEAEWVKTEPNPATHGLPNETTYQRSMRERMELVVPSVAARRPGAVTQPNPMEILDGLTRIAR